MGPWLLQSQHPYLPDNSSPTLNCTWKLIFQTSWIRIREYCSPQQLSVGLGGPPKDPINRYAFSFMVADVRYYTLSTIVKGLLDHGIWKLLWQAVKTQQLALTDLAGSSNTTYNSIWPFIILASELEIPPGTNCFLFQIFSSYVQAGSVFPVH